MRRLIGLVLKTCWALALANLVLALGASARGELIRAHLGRSFPDLAGDIVGSQTYNYDPDTRTGIFAMVNAPHLIALGPTDDDLVPMSPLRDGTLSQSLRMKLDSKGRLLPSSDNLFEVRGSVAIGDRSYEGLLLVGRPIAFGAAGGGGAAGSANVFDLNLEITGGALREAFGPRAYLRITPQSGGTFQGRFTTDFSGELPLTNLRAIDRCSSTSVPRAAIMTALLGCLMALLARCTARCLARAVRSWRTCCLRHARWPAAWND